MKKLKRYRLHLLFSVPVFIILCLPAAGKDYVLSGIGAVKGDASRVEVRAPSAAKMNEFREDSDFSYDRERPPVTFFQKVKYWLLQRITDILYLGAEYHIWKILVYAFVAAAVIYIVFRLFKTDVQGLFYRKKTSALSVSTGLLPEEEQSDYDSLIARYVSEKNFRHAVRVMYVKLLHDLAARGLIELRIDKTNREYINELGNPEYRKNFREATRWFDYVWYGNFSVDESVFQSIEAVFSGLPVYARESGR